MTGERAGGPTRTIEHPPGRPAGEMAVIHPTDGQDGAIRLAALVDGGLRELDGSQALAALPSILSGEAAVAWIDLTDPSSARVAEVAGLLGLHHLIVEDILEGNQRAKIEVTDDLVHLVLHALEYRDAVVANEVDIVLGPHFLLTVHETGWQPGTGPHFRAGPLPLLRHGPDHLLWAIADEIVDGYFPFADRLGDAIDNLQDEVVGGATPAALERLFRLKRELIAIRRAVSPIREVFNQLTNRDLAVIEAHEILYFRDVYDHVIRLTDELDTDRELVATTLEVHLSRVNNDLSLIMKRLTGVTVILAGAGAIAGLFGMSEAGSAFRGGEASGFWLVTIATVTLALGAAWVLHRLDWI
jgi:magnesium transporter